MVPMDKLYAAILLVKSSSACEVIPVVDGNVGSMWKLGFSASKEVFG